MITCYALGIDVDSGCPNLQQKWALKQMSGSEMDPDISECDWESITLCVCIV